MKSVLIILGVGIVIIVGLLIFQNSLKGALGGLIGKQGRVTIQTHVFNVAIAKTEQEKEIGLSGKTSLKENSGMIFPFEKEGYYSFWMKDMKFPIDMLFINKSRKIVTILKDVQPPKSKTDSLPSFTSTEPADTVLEIQAGISDKFNFKIGDDVIISL